MRQRRELGRDGALVAIEDLADRRLPFRCDEIDVRRQLGRRLHVPEEWPVLGRVTEVRQRTVEPGNRSPEALAPFHAVRSALGPRTAVEPGEERDDAVAAATERLAGGRPDEARRSRNSCDMLERSGRELELGRIRLGRMNLEDVVAVIGAQAEVQIALTGKGRRAPLHAVHLACDPGRLRCVDEDPHRANVPRPARIHRKSSVAGASEAPLAVPPWRTFERCSDVRLNVEAPHSRGFDVAGL